jgi:hypothetical protein
MEKVVPIPPAEKYPPAGLHLIKTGGKYPHHAIWYEVQIPDGGKKFVYYGSAGQQFHLRIHLVDTCSLTDSVVGELTKYCFEGSMQGEVYSFCTRHLEKYEVPKHKWSEVWDYRAIYTPGLEPQIKKFRKEKEIKLLQARKRHQQARIDKEKKSLRKSEFVLSQIEKEISELTE